MPEPVRIAVIHGPNLNLLGQREPEIYGHTTLAELNAMLAGRAKELGGEVDCFQSNHEGAIVDHLHSCRGRVDGVLINPGGLTHTSVVLRDALTALDLPVIEIHLSNVFARESFRHHSYVSGVALGVVSGLGVAGYRVGLEALLERAAG